MKVLNRTVWVLSLVSLFADVASEMLYPVIPVYLREIGFSVLLIGILFVHELGHFLAMRVFGYRNVSMFFIPFLGALIKLRQQPGNAKVEAVVGIGGPVAGTAAALACYALYLAMPPGTAVKPLVYVLAHLGFLLNLFNLLPVPPLDGGRVTAAVSPKIWMLGIAALVAYIVREVAFRGRFPFVLVLVLLFALPRVRATLAARNALADSPYYAISSTARWSIGVLYLALGVGLGVLAYVTRDALGLL